MMIGAVSGYYPNTIYTNTLTRANGAAASGVQTEFGFPLGRADEAEKPSANPDDIKKPGRRSSPEDCETCKNRKYQDGSDEANVSFKSASHISPESAGAKVRAHENEHVSNAYKEAAQKNGKVINASVSIHTAVCPECGRTYVSGGTTNTMIKYTNEENPYVKEQKARDAAAFRGANIDYAA